MNSIPKTDRPVRGRVARERRAELRELKNAQPDLASAADMQIELLGAQRRVQSRVPLPSVTFDRRKPDNSSASRSCSSRIFRSTGPTSG